MKKTRVVSFGALSALLLAFAACDGQDVTGPSSETTGIKAHALVTENNTGVTEMQFSVQRLVDSDGCSDTTPAGDPVLFSRPLDFSIPGDITELENRPLDEDSQHWYSDLFELLSAGCYNVTATPMEGEAASQVCGEVTRMGVEIEEGQVTEIFLISQCLGVDPGALDAIVALNREPVLESVVFDPSKFGCAEEPIRMCATASDPDADPKVFELVTNCTVTEISGPVATEDPDDDDSVIQCWDITCSYVGRNDINVAVLDQIRDGGDPPSHLTYEAYYEANGRADEVSRSELNVYVYVDDCSGTGGAGGAGASGGAGGAI